MENEELIQKYINHITPRLNNQKSGLVLLKYIPKLDAMSYKFDFEIGHLVKSPCRECQEIVNFPECAETCIVLGRLQSILSEGISCTRRI